VAVDVERGGRGRVTQLFANRLEVDTARNQERGAIMPQIVDTHIGQLGLLQNPVERTPNRGPLPANAARLVREYKVKVLPRISRRFPFLRLLAQVANQGVTRNGGEVQGPSTTGSLRTFDFQRVPASQSM